MAEEKVEVRDVNFRQILPWTEIFRGFQVALDPKKMALAAAGVVVMSLGWWVLSLLFVPGEKPQRDPEAVEARLQAIREKHGSEPDLDARLAEAQRRYDDEYQASVKQWELLRRTAGERGTLSTLPWNEDRGPNPYLLVADRITGERTHTWDARQQLYVALDPLVKFLRPIYYMLKPEAGFKGKLYFLLVILWTVATWGFFGGAITRMAAVQLTRKEKIGLPEAVRFAWARYVSFFAAPLFPLLFVSFILVLLVVFGALHLIPLVGDVVDGIGWFLPLIAGVVMGVILLGLVGWPLMYATISVEGSDSFDALSRSYSYVYQCPWHYLWNSLVAVAYGALLILFVGFMGSMMVYLGKWGVAQTPGTTAFDRDPAYLFVYAPESFGWRNLLLEGSPYADPVQAQKIHWHWWNYAGAGMVSLWVYAAFLLVVGFGYSYFWCASTIIYLLMRRQVDDTDLDEIYLEEDEAEDMYSATVPTTGGAPVPAPSPAPSFQMVDAPTLRPSAPSPAKVEEPPAPPAETSAAPAAPSDGAAPPLS